MSMLPVIEAPDWYETIRMGDDITLIHEPWIKPFFRCNIWHVRGRDRDLLFDTGLGHFSLKRHVPLVSERKLTCVASHTHFDHIGCHHEFPDRCVHSAEAAILADPRNEWTVADRYANEQMFDRQPQGWDTASYRIPPAPANRLLEHGDVVDLGDRAFEVFHTPGHSPGGIALYEKKTGILLSGDIVYDGPLIDDVYHSDIDDYVGTLLAMRELNVSVVHGGHFPSFGKVRYRQLIDEYVAGKRKPGCHLQGG
ncbi:MBL fold metallo-hydrolase [Mesorhizobium sp. M2D.F.Ca.ET.185.01.1.1]|uniref:MBL fold metallo-hydrolase n=1 Tax=unclassified Mesorhizobium TaxID=325217 RepID=UPI000FCCC0C4|nr:MULTISPECIES: MBL fold metallo-hydrolase [unclassified Mesorhizobium]TGP73749.1 MBL fold metallo-hydrolase [bacterium M00.F.Ca.ET.227.01.1.1]TGP86473.1 MBL fold metallo-hydrolase [bacterium M00.F.Ca.ET.221.01.1.1]TGP87575.1 MBL fold metallo-hydrolase [bacterium M00.F.Ca.ET.222.01.1.1]TGU04578.1 MBL fold metallo-hydrolase [bacterium M00.F.Ca.ET.163.01.1.1]TGU33918.1 MBL fold metallo-hydrolase [bacterium M00.F.Ca.ET.156.01.1.1]TGU43306.1 MBL fold metallo-hydrolase [bacterium M00.F.Ca.ET.146.